MAKRDMALLCTEKSKSPLFDAILTIGLKGQKALQVRQLFTIELLYKNWDDPIVQEAVKLINKTEL